MRKLSAYYTTDDMIGKNTLVMAEREISHVCSMVTGAKVSAFAGRIPAGGKRA